MNTWYLDLTPNKQLKVTTERVKVLRVIGEGIGQIVVEKTIPLDAIKIDHAQAELRDVTDHLFEHKVVKQGLIHIQIFYVNPHNAVLHTDTDIHFSIPVDICGLKPNPYIEVQNHLLDITPKVPIVIPPACDEHGTVEIKVVAHVLIKVAEWVQKDIITHVDTFPKTILSQCLRCH